MDPAGLAVGVIGLAGLFTTCLDAADKIDDYRHFKSDSRALATQFKAYRLRLEHWGEAVGLVQGILSPDHHHKALDDPETLQTVQDILSIVREICKDDGPVSANWPLARSPPLATKAAESARTTKRQKLAWMLRGKAKRTIQVEKFGLLVQHLHDLVPQEHGAVGSQAPAQDADWMMELRNTLERIEEEIQAEARRELHAWLIRDPPNELYDDTLQKRLEGTCNWILKLPVFLNWLSPASPAAAQNARLLWVNGPAGFGKTVLCASVIDFLSTTVQTPVAHFFFSSDFESRSDPYIAVRSWISQMISVDRAAFDFVRGRRETHDDEQVATRATVLQIFQQVTHLVPGCVFVLDGLDECSWLGQEGTPRHGDSIAGFLEKLGQAVAGTDTRILIVSRNEPEIRCGIESSGTAVSEYSIAPEDLQGDIRLYSRSVVERKLSKKSESLKSDISQKMAERCGGQFLWIGLQEDSLRNWKNQKQLEDTIDKTPSGLDLLYQRNWTRMSRLPDTERDRAFSLLRWAAFALRPLIVCEIVEAVLIDLESDELPVDEMPDAVDDDYINSEILGLCGSLLNVRGASSESTPGLWTVRLAHFSVKQYFLSHSPTLGSALRANESLRCSNERAENTVLARLCLRYINYEQVWQGSYEKDSGQVERSFRDYAAGLWHRHVGLGNSSEVDMTELVDALFDEENANWEPWRRWFDANNKELKGGEKDDGVESGEEATSEAQPIGPMYYAARLNLTETTIRLIKTYGHCLNERSYSGETALAAACENGNETIVRALIGAGANVSISNFEGKMPLYAAASAGHLKLAQLLLTNGADPQGADPQGVTPLHAAAGHGHVEVAKLLLQHGADLASTTTLENETPLDRAAVTGQTELVRLFLERGADVSVADIQGWTPLFAASHFGFIDVARLLLDNGADINRVDNNGRTVLIIACLNDQREIVQMLVERGANLALADNDGWTALMNAAWFGHAGAIRVLLENGANCQIADEDSWIHLIGAAFSESIEAVKLFLEYGADVSAQDKDDWTPLTAAISRGRADMVELLLGLGADHTGQQGSHRVPIIVACFEGHIKIVELLLENGADISVVDSDGTTPLLAAVSGEHEELARLLMERGADVTVADNDGTTPLRQAICRGSTTLLLLLLEKTGVTAADQRGWMPLSWAATCGHVEIIRLLIDKGSDPKARDADGYTPLHSAASCGHVEAVEFFLKQVGRSDVNAVDNGDKTPLHVASIDGHAGVAELLLKVSDSSLSQRDKHGRTPLFYAVMRGRSEVVQLLLSKQAEVMTKDRYGSTALLAAARNGHSKILENLLAVEGISARNGHSKMLEALQAIKATPFHIKAYWCDVCTRCMQGGGEVYECKECDGGDFLACAECVSTGAKCWNDAHKWTIAVD